MELTFFYSSKFFRKEESMLGNSVRNKDDIIATYLVENTHVDLRNVYKPAVKNNH